MLKILVALLWACCLAESKIVQSTYLFRHGARYPVSDIYDGK